MNFLSSLTPSQIKVSLFFAALLWLYAAVDGNFYLMVVLPWALYMLITSWKRANPGVTIFEDRDEPAAEKAKAGEPAKESDEELAKA